MSLTTAFCRVAIVPCFLSFVPFSALGAEKNRSLPNESFKPDALQWSEAKLAGNGCPSDEGFIKAMKHGIEWSPGSLSFDLDSNPSSASRFCRLTAKLVVPEGWKPERIVATADFFAGKTRQGATLAFSLFTRMLGIDLPQEERSYMSGDVFDFARVQLQGNTSLADLAPASMWCQGGAVEGLFQSTLSAIGQVTGEGGRSAFGTRAPVEVKIRIPLVSCSQ
ncbi:MAG: hypothetical protein IOD12_13895 [Silvanigrellales bacterium]|nr:hypothetical protein [Silvanigrellales bacterium]